MEAEAATFRTETSEAAGGSAEILPEQYGATAGLDEMYQSDAGGINIRF